MRRSDHTWSWMDDVLPFAALLMITCLDMAVLTVVKAAMNDGMASLVYVVYRNALGTLILLPFFILHVLRKVDRPPLTLGILFRFFMLGLFGNVIDSVVTYFFGQIVILTLYYGFYVMMEKIDIRNSSSVGKLLGTRIAISGAMVFTFYQGPRIFHTVGSPNQLSLSHPLEWIFGGLVIFISGAFGCLWNVLQTATAREYPDQQTIVFFCCLFGTIQCMALSPFLERNPSAWVLQPETGVTAVVLGGVYSTAIHKSLVTWCLRKKGPVFVAMFSPLSIVIAVIMGVTFLGDSLHLGSVIGATIIVAGFYTVIWGQAEEKNKLLVVMDEDLDVSRSSVDQTTPLLRSRNESEC